MLEINQMDNIFVKCKPRTATGKKYKDLFNLKHI